MAIPHGEEPSIVFPPAQISKQPNFSQQQQNPAKKVSYRNKLAPAVVPDDLLTGQDNTKMCVPADEEALMSLFSFASMASLRQKYSQLLIKNSEHEKIIAKLQEQHTKLSELLDRSNAQNEKLARTIQQLGAHARASGLLVTAGELLDAEKENLQRTLIAKEETISNLKNLLTASSQRNSGEDFMRFINSSQLRLESGSIREGATKS